MPSQPRVEDISTVRILLIGDPGVGKTSLANLLAANIPESTVRSSSTGSEWCNIQVALHEYPSIMQMPWDSFSSSSSSSSSGSSADPMCDLDNNRTQLSMPEKVPCKVLYFLEFYDMNSDRRLYKEFRKRLYRHIDGIILIYNLMDMKTHDNLHDWLYEPLRELSRQHCKHRCSSRRSHYWIRVPMLVVGSKVDLMNTRRLRRTGSIADQCEADEILLNCLDENGLSATTRNGSRMRNFFNTVIDRKEKYRTRRR